MSDLITAPSGLNQQIAVARQGSTAGQYLTCMVGADSSAWRCYRSWKSSNSAA